MALKAGGGGGGILLPFVLFSIKILHKQEVKYNAVLPPLESYPDYEEGLREKQCFTYKLGQALMDAHKKWYLGGYIKFYFFLIYQGLKKNLKSLLFKDDSPIFCGYDEVFV